MSFMGIYGAYFHRKTCCDIMCYYVNIMLGYRQNVCNLL